MKNRNETNALRIAVIHIAQETNDFNPVLTTLDDYRSFGIFEGREVFDRMRGYGQVGGYLQAVEDSGLEIVSIPIIRAYAVAGGRITREAFDFFQDKIREGLASAGRIDGLALQLHGACAADGVDDVEGAQVEFCRSLLGNDVPIVLGLDRHANVTRKIIENCDAIVGHRTQPHDTFDTGVVGTKLLLRILTEYLSPRSEERRVATWRR